MFFFIILLFLKYEFYFRIVRINVVLTTRFDDE